MLGKVVLIWDNCIKPNETNLRQDWELIIDQKKQQTKKDQH